MSDQAGKKLCPHCKKEIDAEAKKCPHCHSDLRNWFRRHPIVTAIIVLTLLPIVISQISPAYVPAPLSGDEIVNAKKGSAESFGRSYVKSVLKSPSSAKFGYGNSVKVDEKDPNVFNVVSSVKSQNSYGAMLDSTYSLKMRYSGADTKEAIDDGDNWSVIEFYFDGKKIK